MLFMLAVAPVFLLSGIGAIRAVMTQRLSRVVGRARLLEELLTDRSAETPAPTPNSPPLHPEELICVKTCLSVFDNILIVRIQSKEAGKWQAMANSANC
jgi:hypothetical protein